MKSKLLLNGTVGCLHGSDLNWWNLFRPLNHSVPTCTLVKCQYLFSGPSYSTTRLVWNELIEGNLVQMFSDEIVFRLFSYPISLAAAEGTCSGLEYCFTLVLVILSLPWNLTFFIELFQHIVYGWIVMHLYAQRYFLHNTYCCLHST